MPMSLSVARRQALESERKNLFEHTQLEVKKNKEALAKLKTENKDLRSTLSNLMSDQGRNTGSSEVRTLEKDVDVQRRKHDDVKNRLRERLKQVDGMQDKLKDLEKEISKVKNDDTPLTRNIRTLENRLDKAMIKYNEAQSIHKTYEQIVKRLKEERIGFDNQLAAIERTLKAKEKDLEELVLMSHDAQVCAVCWAGLGVMRWAGFRCMSRRCSACRLVALHSESNAHPPSVAWPVARRAALEGGSQGRAPQARVPADGGEAAARQRPGRPPCPGAAKGRGEPAA